MNLHETRASIHTPYTIAVVKRNPGEVRFRVDTLGVRLTLKDCTVENIPELEQFFALRRTPSLRAGPNGNTQTPARSHLENPFLTHVGERQHALRTEQVLAVFA